MRKVILKVGEVGENLVILDDVWELCNSRRSWLRMTNSQKKLCIFSTKLVENYTILAEKRLNSRWLNCIRNLDKFLSLSFIAFIFCMRCSRNEPDDNVWEQMICHRKWITTECYKNNIHGQMDKSIESVRPKLSWYLIRRQTDPNRSQTKIFEQSPLRVFLGTNLVWEGLRKSIQFFSSKK